MHAQIQIFFAGGGGGAGSKPNGEKTALIFFMFVLGFLFQNFPGMREVGSIYLRGGGGPNASFYRI